MLEITRGRARRRLREVRVAAFLIGAAKDCDLVLADPRFPDVHAYLVRHPDGVALRYLGSKPVLTVNGRLLRHARLADGDRIETGGYEFTVRIRPQQVTPMAHGPSWGRLAIDRSLIDKARLSTAKTEALTLLCELRKALGSEELPIRVYAEPNLARGENIAI
jgi:pSer/pThr/pTyr-binding forkhead associated (FHA) protein